MTLIRMLLAALLLALPATANAQKFPPLTGRVVDSANLLSPEQEAQLTQLSSEIEKASTRQFVVATIPDLQGYPIEDYGYKLGRAWGIGQKDAKNGIILIVAPNDRKVRIEVGYGLEPIMTDAYSGMIIDNIILPRFREKDMAGGIMAGSAAIGEQMKLPLEAAEQRAKDQVAVKGTGRQKKTVVGGLIALFWAFVIMAVLFSAIFGRRRRGRRYRGGGGDVANILLWTALDAAMRSGRSGGGGSSWGGGGGGSSWGGGGGFSGGGGSFGGGGASGSW